MIILMEKLHLLNKNAGRTARLYDLGISGKDKEFMKICVK